MIFDSVRPNFLGGSVLAGLLTVSVIITLGVLTYQRLLIGIDFADESHFVAYSFAYLKGHRPFIDDIHYMQMPGLVMYPFLKIYSWFTDPREGIVLFYRQLFFAMLIASASLTFIVTRKRVGILTAGAIASLVLTFIPLNIASLNYNSIGSIGYFSATLCLLGVCWKQFSPFFGTTLASLLFMLAGFCYPPLAFAGMLSCAVFTLWLYKHAKDDLKSVLIVFSGAVVASVLIVASIFIYAGIDNMALVMEFRRELGVHKFGLKAITHLFTSFKIPWILTGFFLVLFFVAQLFNKFYTTITTLLLSIGLGYLSYYLIWSTLPRHISLSSMPNGMMLPLMLLSIPLIFCFRPILNKSTRSSLLLSMVVPGILSGITFAFSSTNWWYNAPLGWISCSIALLIGVGLVSKQQTSQTATIALFLALSCFQCWTQYYHVSGDDRPNLLTTKVAKGAFRGISTSQNKAKFIENVESELASIKTSGSKSVFIFDFFPAGYLLTHMKPRAPMLWTQAASPRYKEYRYNRKLFLRAFQKPERWPDTLVQMKEIPATVRSSIHMDPAIFDPVREYFLKHNYQLSKETQFYRIYRRSNAS